MWNKSVARRVNYKITSRHAQISSFRLSLFSLLYNFSLVFFFLLSLSLVLRDDYNRHHHHRNFEASAHSPSLFGFLAFWLLFFFFFRSDAVVVAWVINCRSSVGKSMDSCSFLPSQKENGRKDPKVSCFRIPFSIWPCHLSVSLVTQTKKGDIYLYPSAQQHPRRKRWRFLSLCGRKMKKRKLPLYVVNVFFFLLLSSTFILMTCRSE